MEDPSQNGKGFANGEFHLRICLPITLNLARLCSLHIRLDRLVTKNLVGQKVGVQ
jgi:hypothetical protein